MRQEQVNQICKLYGEAYNEGVQVNRLINFLIFVGIILGTWGLFFTGNIPMYEVVTNPREVLIDSLWLSLPLALCILGNTWGSFGIYTERNCRGGDPTGKYPVNTFDIEHDSCFYERMLASGKINCNYLYFQEVLGERTVDHTFLMDSELKENAKAWDKL